MQKILAITAALLLGFAVQAGAQEAGSKEKAKLIRVPVARIWGSVVRFRPK